MASRDGPISVVYFIANILESYEWHYIFISNQLCKFTIIILNKKQNSLSCLFQFLYSQISNLSY
jgi:hypothetical protein